MASTHRRVSMPPPPEQQAFWHSIFWLIVVVMLLGAGVCLLRRTIDERRNPERKAQRQRLERELQQSNDQQGRRQRLLRTTEVVVGISGGKTHAAHGRCESDPQHGGVGALCGRTLAGTSENHLLDWPDENDLDGTVTCATCLKRLEARLDAA